MEQVLTLPLYFFTSLWYKITLYKSMSTFTRMLLSDYAQYAENTCGHVNAVTALFDQITVVTGSFLPLTLIYRSM